MSDLEAAGQALVALLGVILSYAFALLPPLKSWFDSLSPKWKPALMFVLLGVVAFGRLAIASHFDWVLIKPELLITAMVWLAAFGANQGTYLARFKQYSQG